MSNSLLLFLFHIFLISVPKSTIILYDHLQVFSSLKNINFRIICNRYGIMRLYKIHEFLCFSKILLSSIFIPFSFYKKHLCPHSLFSAQNTNPPLPEDFSVQTKVSSSLYQMVPAPLTVLSVFGKIGNRHWNIDHNFRNQILLRESTVVIQTSAEKFYIFFLH